VKGRGEAVDDLFRAFQLLGSLQRSFEATETKHRLRRAGFEPTPHELRTPFVPNAFFGEIVLTSAALTDATAGEARCAFYSGVLVQSLSECVATRLHGRPEMQVGIVIAGPRAGWTGPDEEELRTLRSALGPAWSIERCGSGKEKTFCLAAREDVLHHIERRRDDRLGLLRVRDEFFQMRWADLAEAPWSSYEWLARNA
jgi:hypothetical protein